MNKPHAILRGVAKTYPNDFHALEGIDLAVEDGELLTIGYPQIRQLYFQNPTFGFYLLQLTSSRLFKDIEKLEAALARAKSGALAEGAS